MVRFLPLLYFTLFLGALSFGAPNTSYAVDSYTVNNPQAKIIDEHSECRLIINQNVSGLSIMAPTKTANEWSTGGNNFIGNSPSGVTVGSCDNIVYSWGDNSAGQLGNVNNPTDESSPVITFAGNEWLDIDSGNRMTCGIQIDNTAYCWGAGFNGKLGNGSESNKNIPTLVSGGFTWKKISAGSATTCGIRSNDTAYCWGNNPYGQVGDNTTTYKTSPVLVNGGFTWKKIAAGSQTTCGIRSNDTAYCWGRNEYGQIGDNTQINKPVPTLVSGGFTWKDITPTLNGLSHTCAIRSNDRAYCWGWGGNGRLGSAASNGVTRKTPYQVDGGFTWKKISVGKRQACGIRSNDAAYCWGDAANGRLGNGATSGSQTTPSLVSGGHSWKQIDTGDSHTCGLTTGNKIYCWGLMDDGRLGNGITTGNQATPVLVNGGLNWKDVTVGTSHSAGIIDNNPCGGSSVGGYCWYHGGDNQSCDTACSTHGGVNMLGTKDYAGSGGTNANCDLVLDALTGNSKTTSTNVSASGCFSYGIGGNWRRGTVATTSSAVGDGGGNSTNRACACNN